MVAPPRCAAAPLDALGTSVRDRPRCARDPPRLDDRGALCFIRDAPLVFELLPLLPLVLVFTWFACVCSWCSSSSRMAAAMVVPAGPVTLDWAPLAWLRSASPSPGARGCVELRT
jgi:hypothetical protein